eukprot:TRINITY_DN1867_c0_g1_i2.p4 TRINITY_DN1867_c0_g1~~TRINITY_DN1867_c0_g1_i2.p4  ORF type:complete len:122 (+),score=47.11 TRINITY_DN1867_c0_g1_i2:361-726(+)
MQCFLCLYEDGDDVCPPHRHDCRQATLSLGAERVLTVEGSRVTTEHGDILLLDGERHGVPQQRAATGPRISINLFYTTDADLQRGDVSVNSRGGRYFAARAAERRAEMEDASPSRRRRRTH